MVKSGLSTPGKFSNVDRYVYTDLKLRLLEGDRTEWSFAKKINEKYKVTKMVYRIPFYICRKQLNTTPGYSPMLAPPSLFSTKQLV